MALLPSQGGVAALNEISVLERCVAEARHLLARIRTIVLFALDSCCFLAASRSGQSAVTLRLDAIGDFFIWLQSGAVEIADFARDGGRRSVLIANSAWSDYARSTKLWDDVIPVNPVRLMRKPVYRLRILLKIRRLGADVLIQPRHARVFLQEDAIARVSGARTRIGSTGTFLNLPPRLHKWGNRYYERLISANEAQDVHELERNINFVKELAERPCTRFEFPDLEPSPQADTIAIAVGAGQVGRLWPIEHLVELIKHIRTEFSEHRIVLIGSSSERDRASAIQRQAGGAIVNIVGDTNLSEMVNIIAACNLVICNDSSAFHIAMAVGSNALCFLGGGHFGWYAPYPASYPGSAKAVVLYQTMECFWCNWRCKFPRTRDGALQCVAAISVEKAILAVGTLLPTATARIPAPRSYE